MDYSYNPGSPNNWRDYAGLVLLCLSVSIILIGAFLLIKRRRIYPLNRLKFPLALLLIWFPICWLLLGILRDSHVLPCNFYEVTLFMNFVLWGTTYLIDAINTYVTFRFGDEIFSLIHNAESQSRSSSFGIQSTFYIKYRKYLTSMKYIFLSLAIVFIVFLPVYFGLASRTPQYFGDYTTEPSSTVQCSYDMDLFAYPILLVYLVAVAIVLIIKFRKYAKKLV